MGFFNRLSDRVKKSRQSGSNLLKDMKSLQNKKEHRSWLNGRALSFESLENRELLSVNPTAVDDEVYTVSESAATTTMATTDSTSAVSVSTSDNGAKNITGVNFEGRGTQMKLLDTALAAINGADRHEETVNYNDNGGGMLSGHEKNITGYSNFYANGEAMYSITTTSYMETAAELIWASGWGEQAGFANSDAILNYIKTNFEAAYYGRADEVVNWFFSGDFTEINSRWKKDTSTWVYKNNENGGGLFQEVNVNSVMGHTTMEKTKAGDMGAVAVALDAGTAVSIDFTFILQNYSKDTKGLIDNPTLYTVMGNDNEGNQTLGPSTSLTDIDGPNTVQTHTTSLVVKEVLTAHPNMGVSATDPNRYVAIKFANAEPNVGIEADVWYLIEYNTSLECYTFAVEPYWYYYRQNVGVTSADTRAQWDALRGTNSSETIQFRTWISNGGNLDANGNYTEATLREGDGCKIQYLFKTAQFNHADTDRSKLVSTGNGFYGYIDGYGTHYGYKANKDDKNTYTAPLILNMAFSGYTFLNNYSSKVAPASVEDTLKLESNKTATNVIYLDFSTMGLDSYNETISFQEAQYIQEIWQRVAEDFAPFDVNITTNSALANTGAVNRTVNIGTPLTTAVRSATEGSGYDKFQLGMKSFIGPSFTENTTTFKTPFGKYGGELASYLVGRSLAQGNDQWWNTANYTGSGLWGPIMGNPNSVTNQYTQWSFGEYIGATTSQNDELRAIGNILGFRKDDAGDSLATAVRLEDYIVDVDKQYDVLTALYSGEGADYQAQLVNGYSSSQAMYVFSGVIGVHDSDNTDDGKRLEEYRDYDVFSFTTGDAGGKYVIDVSGIGADLRWNTKDWGYDVNDTGMQYDYYDAYDWWMTNLNLKVEFLLSDGTVLYTFDPRNSSFVHFTTKELDANTTYFLRISGIGEGNPLTNGFSAYGSLGSYALNVSEDLTSKVVAVRDNAIVVTTLNDTIAVDNEITLREALSYIGRRLENGQYISSEIVFSSELEGGTIYLNSGNIYDVENKTEFKVFTEDEEGQEKYDLYLASIKNYGELALNYALANEPTTINAQYFWDFDAKAQDVSAKDPTTSVTWATGTNITIDARPLTLNQDNTWKFEDASIRVIHVENISATLQGLTITGGIANNGASRYLLAADSEEQYGGGIYNDRGWLSVVNCTVAGNEALKAGGGIFNTGGYYNIKYPSTSGSEHWRNDFYGKLVVINSQIIGNVTTYSYSTESGGVGGGLYNDFFGEVFIYNSTVSGNTSAFSGGGIENYGRLRIANSIVAENYSSVGVDIFTKVDAFTIGVSLLGDEKNQTDSTLVYNSLIGSRSINDDENGNGYGQKYGKEIDNITTGNNVYGTYDVPQDPGFLIAPDYQKANRDGVYNIIDTLKSWNVDLWKDWNLRLNGQSAAKNIGGSGTVSARDGHNSITMNLANPALAKTGLTYGLVSGKDLAGYDRVVGVIDAGAFELQDLPDFTDYVPTINTYEDSLMNWKDSVIVSRSQKDRTGIAEGTYDADNNFYLNFKKEDHPEIIETAETEDLYISCSFMNVSADVLATNINDVVSTLKLKNYGQDGVYDSTKDLVLFDLHISGGYAGDNSKIAIMPNTGNTSIFGTVMIGKADGTNNQLAKGSWDYIYNGDEKIGKITYKDNGIVLVEDLCIGSLLVGYYAVELELDSENKHPELEEINNTSCAMFKIVKIPTVVVNTLDDNRSSDDYVSLYEAMTNVGKSYSSEYLVDGNEIKVDDVIYTVIDGKFYTYEKGYFYEDVYGNRTALTVDNTYYLADGVVINVLQGDTNLKIQLNAKNESGRIDAVFNEDGSFTINTDTLAADSLNALLVVGNTYKINGGITIPVGENEQPVTLLAKNENNLIDIIFNGDGTFTFVEDTLREATIHEIKQYNEESLTLENDRLDSSLLVSLTKQTKVFLSENTMFFATDSQYSAYRYGFNAGTGYSNYVTIRYTEKVFDPGTAIEAIYNNYGEEMDILIRYTAGGLDVEEAGKFIYNGKTHDYENLNAVGNPGYFKVTVAQNTNVIHFVDSIATSTTLTADTEMIWYYGDVWVTKAGDTITGYYELSEGTTVAINGESGSYFTDTKKTDLLLEDGEELITADEQIIVYKKINETTSKFYLKDSTDSEEYIPQENEIFTAYLTLHETTTVTSDTVLTIKKGDIVSQTTKLGTTVYFSHDIRERLNNYDYKEAYNVTNNDEAISWINIPVDGITLLQDIVIEGRYFANEDASIFYDRDDAIIYQSGLDSYLEGNSETNKNLDYEIYVAYNHDISNQNKLFANLDNIADDGDMKFVYTANNIHFVNGYGNVSLDVDILKKNSELADWTAPLTIFNEMANEVASLKNTDILKMDAAFVGELAVLANSYVNTNTGFTATITSQYQLGEIVSPEVKLFEIRCNGSVDNKFSYKNSDLTITSDIYGQLFVKEEEGVYSNFTEIGQGETVDLYYKNDAQEYVFAATFAYTHDLYLYDNDGIALDSTEIGKSGTGSYLVIKDANLGYLPTGTYTFTMTLTPEGDNESNHQDNIYSTTIRVIESSSNVVTTVEDIVDPYDGKTSFREAILADSITYASSGNRIVIGGLNYDIVDDKFYIDVKGDFYTDPTTNAIADIHNGSSFYLYENAIVTYNTGYSGLLTAGTKITYENDQFYYYTSGKANKINLSNNSLLCLYESGIGNDDYVIYFNHKNAEVNLKSGTVIDQVMDAYDSLWFTGNATFNQVQNGNFLVSMNSEGVENYLNLENVSGNDELWVRVSADEILNNPGCVQKLNPSSGEWEDLTFSEDFLPEDLDLIWSWGDVWTVSMSIGDGTQEYVSYYRLVGNTTVTAISSQSGAVVAGQTYTCSSARTQAFDGLVDGMILVDETTGAQFKYQETTRDFLCIGNGNDTDFQTGVVYNMLSMTSSYKYEKIIEQTTEDKIISVVDSNNFMYTDNVEKTIYFSYELADKLDDYDVTFDYNELNTKTGQFNNEAVLLEDVNGVFQKIDLVNNVTFEGRYFMEEVSVGQWKAVDASGNDITDLGAYKQAWNKGTELENIDKVDSVIYVYYPSFVDNVFSIADDVSYSCQNVQFINGKGEVGPIFNEADIYVTTIQDFVDLTGYFILNTSEDYVDYSYNYADTYKELTSVDAVNKLQITVLAGEIIEIVEGSAVELTKDIQLTWKGNGVWTTGQVDYKLADGTKILYDGAASVYTTQISDKETSLREAINTATSGNVGSLEGNKAVIKINQQAIPELNPEFNLMLGALEIGYVKDADILIVIDGTSAKGGSFTIDAQHLSRAINVTTSVVGYVPSVELIGLTIMNGKIADSEGTDVGGAAINSVGVVSIKDCKIIDNDGSFGGAVRNTGSMTIIDSLIADNTGISGTIYNSGDGSSLHCAFDGLFSSGELTIYRTQISGNVSTNYGGAISNTGKLYIADSVMSGNKAKSGGGIFVLKSRESTTETVIVNCTIVGNYAESTGGALWTDCEVTLQNSILIGNVAGTVASNEVYLKNGTNVGSFSSDSHNNLSSIALGINSVIYSKTDAQTGLLDYSELFVNFEPMTTLTWSVDKYTAWDLELAVSENGEFTNLAIDGGYESVSDRSVDFLGHNRVYNSNIDIGAYEYQPDVWAKFEKQPVENVTLNIDETEKIITATFIGSAFIPSETVIASIQTTSAAKDTIQYSLLSGLDFFKIDDNGNLLTSTIWSYSADVLPNIIIRVSGLDTETGYEDLEYSITMLEQAAASSIYKVNQITGSKVRINWQSVSGAAGYRVRYKEVSSNDWTYCNSMLTGTSGDIIGAFVPGLTYAFQVQAVANGIIASDWSDAPVEDSEVSESATLTSGGSVNRYGFSGKQCLTFGNVAPVLNSTIKSDFGVLGDQLVSLNMDVLINSLTTSISSWQINWGDGTVETINSTAFTCKALHYYQNNGDYSISVKIGDTAGYNKDSSFIIGTHNVSTASELVELESESVSELPAEEVATDIEPWSASASAPVFSINFSAASLLEMEYMPVSKLTPIGTLTEVISESEQVRSTDLNASLLNLENEDNDYDSMNLTWLDKETENGVVESLIGSQNISDRIFEDIFEDYLN